VQDINLASKSKGQDQMWIKFNHFYYQYILLPNCINFWSVVLQLLHRQTHSHRRKTISA